MIFDWLLSIMDGHIDMINTLNPWFLLTLVTPAKRPWPETEIIHILLIESVDMYFILYTCQHDV